MIYYLKRDFLTNSINSLCSSMSAYQLRLIEIHTVDQYKFNIHLLNLKILFTNPYSIRSLFRFKDILAGVDISRILYLFTCPKCTLET